jgi:hypothetical protein
VSLKDMDQVAFLAKLVNAMYPNVLNPESHKDPDFKLSYDKIDSPLANKEKGERYVYLDKLQNKTKTSSDVTRVSQAIEKDTAFKRFLGKIDNKNELSSFILALFLYKDTKGTSLFDPKQTFATDTGKVRAAMFGLNNRIPNTLTEEEQDELIRKFPDVQAAYTYIGKSSTLRNLLKNINNIEEFYQLVLRSILPYVNPKFKTEDGIGELKSAIALAANKSKEFQNILNKNKNKKK